MELTWITFPTIVVTVSLVAYYAAYLLKGNDLLVNKVDVVDIDQAAGLARGKTWISLFSPQNRDYTLRTIPVPLDRDTAPLAAADPSGEPARPPSGTEVVTSWFSAPENQFGAMGNSGRRFSFAGNGYTYAAHVGRRVARECPDSDLEHEVHLVALVRSGRSPGRLRLAARGDRPAGGDHHQPPVCSRSRMPFWRSASRSICWERLPPGPRSASSSPAIETCRGS